MPPLSLPYTAEEVNKITDPEARARARAELNSFIARLRLARKDGKHSEEYTLDGSSSTEDSSQTERQRGGNRGNQRGHSFHRGGFHPYQRPRASQAPFKNNSVTFTKTAAPTESSFTKQPAANNANQEQDTQRIDSTSCPSFTRSGKCTRHGCHLTHDPNKVAVCKPWLYSSTCPRGDSCPLSHRATAHNAPTCDHFQDARCNNEQCRFGHVRISPAAQNCVAFGTMFYCEKGSECAELHAFECPYYSNSGTCYYGDNCRNGHVRNAAKMRKARSQTSSPATDVQDDSNATDPHESNEPSTENSGDSHAFTQQDDYLPI